MKTTHVDGVVRLGLAEPEYGFITLPEINQLLSPAPACGGRTFIHEHSLGILLSRKGQVRDVKVREAILPSFVNFTQFTKVAQLTRRPLGMVNLWDPSLWPQTGGRGSAAMKRRASPVDDFRLPGFIMSRVLQLCWRMTCQVAVWTVCAMINSAWLALLVSSQICADRRLACFDRIRVGQSDIQLANHQG
jgi:hypothetical protein